MLFFAPLFIENKYTYVVICYQNNITAILLNNKHVLNTYVFPKRENECYLIMYFSIHKKGH